MDLVRGGAVVYMTVTGVVFSVLLSGTNVDTAIPWVNDVVHEVMPIVMVADWLLDPPRSRLTLRDGLLWLSYPAAWLVYTLIKGPIVDKYPVPVRGPRQWRIRHRCLVLSRNPGGDGPRVSGGGLARRRSEGQALRHRGLRPA